MTSGPSSALKIRMRVEQSPNTLVAQTLKCFPLHPDRGRGEKMPVVKSHFYFSLARHLFVLSLLTVQRALTRTPQWRDFLKRTKDAKDGHQGGTTHTYAHTCVDTCR